MKVTITFYQSLGNPEMGFSIQNDEKTITLWLDEYEGGEAYITDWHYIDEFKTEEAAYEYLVKNYGPVKKLDI